ncbi:hypothetical protein TYRP_009973 [Tyrophagus putrescentiae]|nr:hypothetical protein TYRP_009973 [Tyrophagus putrescentiae]
MNSTQIVSQLIPTFNPS